MIRVSIAADNSGCVRRVEIHGHAGLLLSGGDPACSAVSVLAKAYALTVAENPKHRIFGNIDKPGLFACELQSSDEYTHAFAAGRVLLNGLESVRADYPENIVIELDFYT
ncbi:MAG: ribosomal-processing cysteine protease Prp [Spirochaeta sp.]